MALGFPPPVVLFGLLMAIAAEVVDPVVAVVVALVGPGKCSTEAAEWTENEGE